MTSAVILYIVSEENEPRVIGVSLLIIIGSGKASFSSTFDIIDSRVAKGWNLRHIWSWGNFDSNCEKSKVPIFNFSREISSAISFSCVGNHSHCMLIREPIKSPAKSRLRRRPMILFRHFRLIHEQADVLSQKLSRTGKVDKSIPSMWQAHIAAA